MSAPRRIKILALQNPVGRFDGDQPLVDRRLTPKAIPIKAARATKSTISDALKGRAVVQMFELMNDPEDGPELLFFDESALQEMGDDRSPPTIYVEVEDHDESTSDVDSKDMDVPRHHLQAALLCAALYEENPSDFVKDQESQYDFEDSFWSVAVSHHQQLKLLVAKAGQTRFVAFRGTHTDKDWETNLAISASAPFCGGFFHQGFHALSQSFNYEAIGAWLHCDPYCKKVVIAGHSMGGAVAGILALRCFHSLGPGKHTNIEAVMFGAPFFATQAVAAAAKANHWHRQIFNYVVDVDVVPRLLLMRSADIPFLVQLSGKLFLGRDFELPEYGAVGSFCHCTFFPEHTEFFPPSHPEGKPSIVVIPARREVKLISDPAEVVERLGKPTLTGELGRQALQSHFMRDSYLFFLRHKVRGPRRLAALTSSLASSMPSASECFGRLRRRGLAVGNEFCGTFALGDVCEFIEGTSEIPGTGDVQEDAGRPSVIVCKILPEGSCGVRLMGASGDSVFTVPASSLSRICSNESIEAPTHELNLRYRCRTEGGFQVATHIEAHMEIPEKYAFWAESMCWSKSMQIEGFNDSLANPVWKTQILSGLRKVRVHFSVDVEPPTAPRSDAIVKVHHLFKEGPVEFTTKGDKYVLKIETPVQAMSPFEGIMDSATCHMIEKAFRLLILEIGLGPIGKLPINSPSRSQRYLEHPLMRHLMQLETLVNPAASKSDFTTFINDNFGTFQGSAGSACIDQLRKILDEARVTMDSKVIGNISKYLFERKAISYPRRLLRIASVAAMVGGGVVLCAAGGPVCWYGSFLAASQATLIGNLGAGMIGGAAIAGVGIGGLSISVQREIRDEYKDILRFFIRELHGGSMTGAQDCFSLEQKIESLAKLQLYPDHRNHFHNGDFTSCEPKNLTYIWKGETDNGKFSLANATHRSQQLATSHMCASQPLKHIRMELLRVKWIGVFGKQNAGKSTFVKTLWPQCEVEGIGGCDSHTIIPSVHVINDELRVVDFPGTNDWSDLSFLTHGFLAMVSFAVVLFKFEDIELEARKLLDDLQKHKACNQIAVYINHADRYAEELKTSQQVERYRAVYASRERLDIDRSSVSLTAMTASDGNAFSQTKLDSLVSVGVKGPVEVYADLKRRMIQLHGDEICM